MNLALIVFELLRFFEPEITLLSSKIYLNIRLD